LSDLSPEQLAPELIGTGAKALVGNAKRLGLQWTLRLATVVEGSNASAVSATYDGDTVPISMTSMIGTMSVGQRVYVIQVPPSGNFIVGMTPGMYRARQTLAGTQATIVFSDIPSGLRSLIVRWTARSDTGGSDAAETRMQVNSLGTAIYGFEYIQAQGAALTGTVTGGATSMFVGHHAGGLAASGLYATGEICFADWDIATTRLGSCNWEAGAFVAGGLKQNGTGFINLSAIRTSLTFFPSVGSWASGTDFQLEGVPS